VAAGKFLGDPSAPTDPQDILVGLAISPDGRRVLATSRRRMAPGGTQSETVSRLWEPGRAEPIGEPWPEVTAPSSSSSISRDSRRVFVLARTGIEARDLENGRHLWSFAHLSNGPGRVVLESPDGTRVFVSSIGPGGGGPVSLVDTQTGQPIAGGEKLGGSTAMNTHYQWSADSRLLLEAGDDDLVRVWDARSFTAVGPTIRANDLQYQMTSISPDGQRVLTVHGNNSVRVWDIRTGRPLTPQLTHIEPVTSAQFSPSGSRVLTTSGRAVYIWPLATPPLGRVLNSESAVVTVEGRSPDARLLVLRTAAPAGRQEDRIEILHCATGERFALTGPVIPAGRASGIPNVLFSPDTKLVMSSQWVGDSSRWAAAADRGETRVLVWETATGRRLADFRKPGSNVTATFSLDGKRILLQHFTISSGVRDFSIIDPSDFDRAASWCKLDVPPLPKESVPGEFGRGGSSTEPDALTFSHDGSRFLHVRTERVVDSATGRVVGTFGPSEAERQGGWKLSERLTPDRRFALWYDGAKQCQLHNTETGEPAGPVMTMDVSTVTFLRYFNPLVFNADGSRFIIAPRMGPGPSVVQAWDAVAGKPLTPLLSLPSRVTDSAFSPDNQLFLTVESAGTIRVWEMATGELAIPPLVHAGAISMARFSQDGKRILTVSRLARDADGRNPITEIVLNVWETATGRPLTPPLPCNPGRNRVNDYTVFDVKGTTALRTDSEGVLEVTDFTADERPPEELRAFAEMLSGRRLNAAGRLVQLSEERFRDDWKRMEAWA
jgi:WD40 repeat protein